MEQERFMLCPMCGMTMYRDERGRLIHPVNGRVPNCESLM